jgi:hypothetical protein
MIAILFDNKKRLPAVVAVAMAKREFAEACHTRGHKPRAVVFNPAQAPEEAVIGGLTVYTDREVPLNRVRVCTQYVPSSQEQPL